MENRTYRKYTDLEFAEAVKKARSWSQVLTFIGLKAGGGSYDHIKKLANKLDLDTNHFLGQGWNVGLKFVPSPPRSLEEILTVNSTYGSNKLRLRLIREGIKKHKCEICKRKTWCKKKIPLQLDHINGIRTDNRLENLRIICPNCHSQTPTWCGKNKAL